MVKCACGKEASFAFVGNKPITCGACKIPGYVNVKSKKCISKGCFKQPTFGDQSTKKALHCKDHKQNDEIDVKNKKCIVAGCTKKPNFGNIENNIPIHCKNHKFSEEIDVIHKLCESPGCTIRSTFGIFANKIPIHCSKHKFPGEVDVVNKKCKFKGCNKSPNFGNTTDNKPIHCFLHKQNNEINITSRRCEILGCDKIPNFGSIVANIALHCVEHKLIGEVNIKSKKCYFGGCSKQPIFSYPDSKYGNHCSEHKLEGEIDVVNKKCIYLQCEIHACYGKLFESKTHCTKHRQPNEFIKRNPKCHFPGCENRPTHSQNNYPNSCETHALPGETNIIERPCASCKLEYFIPSSRDTCDYCYNNPDRSGTPGVITTRKLKESAIKSLLTRENIHFESHDKIIENSCSRYRPDFVIDTPYYKIVVEVDEFQHRVYGETCEHNRMMQVMFDSGMQQILFIRYNPDKYYDDSGVECDTRPREREDHLVRVLRSYMNPEVPLSDPGVSIIYLYYDGYNGTPEISKVLNYE